MKILQITKFQYVHAGAERYMFDLSNLLRRHGHEVVPWGMHHPKNVPTPWSRFFVSFRDYSKSEGLATDVEKAANMLWSREAVKKLRALLCEFRPDIVHIHNIYHHLSPSILAFFKKEGIPVVWTVHDFKWICPNGKLYTQGAACERCHVYKYWNAVLYRCADNSRLGSAAGMVEMYVHRALGSYERDVALAITPSAFLRDLLGKWGKDLNKIVHVSNFFDPESLPRVQSVLGDAVVYAGRLSEEKGIETVLHLAEQFPTIPFEILGTGPEEARMKAYISSLRLENVRLRGHLSGESFWQTLATARLIVVPSRWYENFPYAVLEAMALGKTVIASRQGGIPEMITHGQTGFLVPAKDMAGWTKQFGEIIRDDAVLARVGAAAKIAVRRYGADEHYRKITDIYQQVIAKSV